MTHSQIILALAPYAVVFVVTAAIAVAAVIGNWRLHQRMDVRVSKLFPG